MSQARADIALRATWQLSSVLGGITEIARKNDNDELPVHGHLLALAMRADDLNNVLSAAIGDEIETVVHLLEKLNEGDVVTDAEAANG